jgi:hypothetical protein
MLTPFQRDAILSALTAVAAPWAAAGTFVGGYVSVDDKALNTVLADFVLPPGALATAVAVTAWGTAQVKADGRAVRDSQPFVIRPASVAEATSIAGIYVADAATGGNLKDWWAFPSPVPLTDETQAITVILRVVVNPTGGRWISAVLVNS